MKNFDRRKFIKTTSLSAAFASSSNLFSNKPRSSDQKYMGDFAAPRLDKIKIALIGVGSRGQGHVKRFGSFPNTQIVAISDLHETNISKSLSIIDNLKTSNSHINPKTYSGNKDKWRIMLKETDADIVIISTDWDTHGIMAIESMKNNMHAFVEVPLATTIKDLWEIVNTSEIGRAHV